MRRVRGEGGRFYSGMQGEDGDSRELMSDVGGRIKAEEGDQGDEELGISEVCPLHSFASYVNSAVFFSILTINLPFNINAVTFLRYSRNFIMSSL